MIKIIIGAVLGFVIVVFGVNWILQPNDIKRCQKPNSSDNCDAADAIVAISGGDTRSRANYAIKLYKDGWSDTLIFSGAAMDKSGPSNAAVMKSIAIDAGVPDEKIIVDENSETTQQNALNSNEIFIKRDFKRVILVTSGYHQKRAGLEFTKQADGIAILNAPVATDRDWSPWWWLTINGWWLALSEVIKIIAFYVFGTISWIIK